MKGYPDDIEHPYRAAAKVCAYLDITGETLSRETIAKKLKLALATTAVNDEV